MALEPLTYPHEITEKCLQNAEFSTAPHVTPPSNYPQSSLS